MEKRIYVADESKAEMAAQLLGGPCEVKKFLQQEPSGRLKWYFG